MLLQTFVQLNILLLAAPALAGWVGLPLTHPSLTQAALVAFQPLARQSEATPQAAEECDAPAQKSPARPAVALPANQSNSIFLPAPPAFSASDFPSFPRTARAP